MNIERVKHLNHLFGIELCNLMERLPELNFPAYWTYLVENINTDEFALCIAWDDKGLHGMVHFSKPWDVLPEEGEFLFAVTDSTLTKEQDTELVRMGEDYLRGKGAVRVGMTSKKPLRALERKYGPFEHQHRLVKKL